MPNTSSSTSPRDCAENLGREDPRPAGRRNHATPQRIGALRCCWTASPQPASAVSRGLSEFHLVRVGEAMDLGAHARQGSGYPGRRAPLDDSHVAAVHFDWPDVPGAFGARTTPA
jgi:hypothetical protein